MPEFWNNTNTVAVYPEELIPRYWKNQACLSVEISRNKNNPFGVKALQRGGGKSKKLVIDFDSLGNHIQSDLGDRQKYMQKFKPYHQLERPKFAGSLISIDDRNPPFKDLDGNRVWFYNGIDLGSECFTTFVYGKTKEGIITEFYRQLVRNYTEWGFNLPDGLEAESALNSSFTNTFLQEGYMFQNVRIEANNARGKRIERYFGSLRYEIEKQREGWLARPHAKSESNQMGSAPVPMIPYDQIVEGAIQDLYTWNNSPHSQDPSVTRWEYFLANQHPELKPTNWKAILPYLGFHTPSSCNAGYIKLQGKPRAIAQNGKICTGDSLITAMKAIEGKDIDIYWLDDNAGNVLKALAFHEGKFICEVQEMPKYNRAVIERDDNAVVPIPNNANAIKLYAATEDSIKELHEQDISEILLMASDLSKFNINNSMKKITLNLSAVAALGLPGNSLEHDEALVNDKIINLKSELDAANLKVAGFQELENDKKAKLSADTVKGDIAAGKIDATKEADYIKLHAEFPDIYKSTVTDLPVKSKLGAQINTVQVGEVKNMDDFQKLELNAQLEFKNSNPDGYKALFS